MYVHRIAPKGYLRLGPDVAAAAGFLDDDAVPISPSRHFFSKLREKCCEVDLKMSIYLAQAY